MQFQADVLDCEVRRPMIRETTALGAAYLAGLAVDVWKDTDEIRKLWNCDTVFQSQMKAEHRESCCVIGTERLNAAKDGQCNQDKIKRTASAVLFILSKTEQRSNPSVQRWKRLADSSFALKQIPDFRRSTRFLWSMLWCFEFDRKGNIVHFGKNHKVPAEKLC